MLKYRETFGKWVNRKAGGFGGGEAVEASGKDAAKIGTITWLVFLLVWVIVSFLLIRFLNGNAVQYILAGLWGFFIGGTMLIFFNQKLLITIIGGIVGTGLSDLAGVPQVIDKTAAAILKITTSLNSALQGTLTIRPVSAWIFLVLIIVCCLPAYKDQ